MREITNVNKTEALRATGALSFIPEGRIIRNKNLSEINPLKLMNTSIS